MADEILSNYQHVVSELSLIPSGGGVFEVVVNEDLIYSKKATKRHGDKGEIFRLFRDVVGAEVPLYGT